MKRGSLVFLLLVGCASAPGGGSSSADLGGADASGRVDDGGGDLATPLVPDLLDHDLLSWSQRCTPWLASHPGGPNYDQFHPKYAQTHCAGTNAQDIVGVQKVVFLGDSVTVGTPPTAAADFYRSKLAGTLAQKFGLDAPDLVWMQANLLQGMSLSRESGDFMSCSKYGAKMDDLHSSAGSNQLDQCFLAVEPKRTLIVTTFGGNDFSVLAKKGMAGTPKAELLLEVDTAIGLLAAGLDELKNPARFPAGSYVILANAFEYTDGTGAQDACPVAGLAGYTKDWPDGPAVFVYLNEQIMKTAVDKGVDLVFLWENFCGHGFKADDAASPCYRGPGTAKWFDPVTCIHPNTAGHAALAGMFESVVDE